MRWLAWGICAGCLIAYVMMRGPWWLGLAGTAGWFTVLLADGGHDARW